MSKRIADKTDTNKKNLLKMLEKSLGVVTVACKKAKVARSMHYQWYNGNAEYRAAVDELTDVALDFAESQLHVNMRAGKESSTIFYLKCRGKSRGYIDKQELDITSKGKAVTSSFDNLSTNEIKKLLDKGE